MSASFTTCSTDHGEHRTRLASEGATTKQLGDVPDLRFCQSNRLVPRPSGVAASDQAAYPTSRGRHRVEHRAGTSVLPNVNYLRPLELGIYAHFLQSHRLVYAEVGDQ